MRSLSCSLARLTFVAALVAGAPVASFAAGPLSLCAPGRPYVWAAGGTNMPFNPDQGGLGPFTNAQAVEIVADAFQKWRDIPTATTTYLNAGPLPVDVDITNFLAYLDSPRPDGFSAIVFDHTGEIFDLLFGPNSGVLGFAGPEWGDASSCQISEGLSFLNGPAFDNPAVALDVLVHEFGHYQNLAHTVVNGQIAGFGDHTGPSPNNTFPLSSLVGTIETMYPFYFGPAAGTSTPHQDDAAGLSTLYPTAGFAGSTGTFAGVIFGPNGTTKLTGVNVIARNIANPFNDAVSAISSDFATAHTQSSRSVGVYTLRGLTPGAQYAVYVDQILGGAFSTPPRGLPSPEEFYNGSNESADSEIDSPSVFTAIAARAGGVVEGVDIILNAFRPGDALPVGDDGAVELFLPFSFNLCGQSFDSAWVNGNGSVTFGLPSADFSETRFEFLDGPPRAAGIWDDLNPAARGVVTFGQSDHAFTISWTDVPEFPDLGANTFAIRLYRQLGLIELVYRGVTVVDGLSGVSCGGKVTSRYETQQDLSQARWFVELLSDPAGFEQFSAQRPFDLAHRTLRFTGTVDYNDRWAGANDTPAAAKRISLPFHSASVLQFTELEQEGDVDFFKFRANAGQILAIEVLTGRLDSRIGLFEAGGNLIAADDDGGSGSLSRLAVRVSADGDYLVCVTTWPDVDFAGATDTGRYVLAVQAFDGALIGPGDDGSVNVPIGFSFPFQGGAWTSVFVNANGNLTFGAGSADPSESVSDFLNGPPRIAPLWDDLDARAGLVIASREAGALTVHYVSVPELGADRPNNFSVRLDEDGRITLAYFGILAPDALTGITEGSGAANPGAADLSRFSVLPNAGTTYELFPATAPFDMPFRKLFFQ